MGEILTASVWNRIMISELDMPATPVGILLVLQYFLLPISLWVGHRSDTNLFMGRRRTSYIWLGRSIMLLSFPLLGTSVSQFEAGNTEMGWMLATISFLLFGGGKLASGSVFLALVRDSAPPEKRGVAIGLTETMLIALFPVAAIGFGRWMEQYELGLFWQLVMITMVFGGFFWWFATQGNDPTRFEQEIEHREGRYDLRKTFGQIWGDARTQAFFVFLGSATFFAWIQDNVMEPFGAEVFDMGTGETTRFTGTWGGMTIIVVLICFAVFRNRRPEEQSMISLIGLVWMGVGMGLLAWASMDSAESLLQIALLNFGIGFGLYTFGGLSLMAAMSPTQNAGAYLGLWTACILLTKGAGTFLGGFLRDLFIEIANLPASTGYGIIFGIAALGLIISGFLVRRVDVIGFTKDNQ